MPNMGLGGTGLERRPLRPSDEGCGEMEVMDGATPKGLEEAGVGETPLLEMVLPGVTAMPGAGDEPAGQRSTRSKLVRLRPTQAPALHHETDLCFGGRGC